MNALLNTELESLEKLEPCPEGLGWARTRPSLHEAWEKCERGDWMFWYLKRKKLLNKEQSVELAIACAERVLAIYEKRKLGDDRPRKAIEAARDWLKNPNATTKAAAAAAAAYAAAAAAAYADAYAAAYADAYAAAYAAAAAAAAAAAYADAAAAAAAAAAYADAYAAAYADAAAAAAAAAAADAAAAAAAAAYADAYAARLSERKAQADIIRKIIPNPFQNK